MTTAERMEKLGQYRPKLIRFARMRLRNPAQAEDAVQETMLAAIEGIEKYAGGSSLSSWLTGILKHKIVDCVRRSARDQWHELDNCGTPKPVKDPDFAPVVQDDSGRSAKNGPEEALAGQRLLEALDRCISQLPPQAAHAYVLRELIGMSAAEASRVLDVSESNCSVLLHRARVRIRERMAPEWAMQ